METVVDVVVLGAGAAGMMCAMAAGRRGRRVVLLDHAEKVGKKILISGGGRANFTNLGATAEHFLSENPHFARSALARYGPGEFVAMVERHGIGYHAKAPGQLFCDRSARDLVAMLERECREAGVRTVLNARVERVSRDGGFVVETTAGRFRAGSLVVATGGLSIPKLGATGLGYEVARQFGLRVVEPRPGLVPLVFGAEDTARWCDLTGLAFEAEAACGRARFRERLLVTHRGLSGPGALQVSSYWRAGEAVRVDVAPGRVVFAGLARRDAAGALAALREVLPGRMAERWLAVYPPAGWTNAALEGMERGVHGWEVVPAGTEGFGKAEVTVGGVDTAALDPRTMECRAVPGLFFVGEVVDVTGWLGGYNFQWAWASGFCAGAAA
jgi:predicted Rossmann fold flavoprotein